MNEAPEGAPPHDLPPQPAVFAPDYAPEEIAEIAARLRAAAGLPDAPTGIVADAPVAKKRSTSSKKKRPKAAVAK